MEARRCGPAMTATRLGLFLFLFIGASSGPLSAAVSRTTNFVVHAPSGALAKQLGEAAEEYRRTLAVEWLGHELPPWEEQCPIHASIHRGAGGETSFYFTNGRVHGWKMLIQGSPERMLDSVLPHEVTHTIFATHFRGPLPRWADEGACTTVEHPGEVDRMERELIKFLKTRRGIRFSDMMWMKEYPRDFMPLYAQGHSVAAYLIGQRGKQAFIRFLEDGLRDDNWPRAAKKHYGFSNLAQMQDKWLGWVRAGRPPLDSGNEAPTLLVSDRDGKRTPSAEAGKPAVERPGSDQSTVGARRSAPSASPAASDLAAASHSADTGGHALPLTRVQPLAGTAGGPGAANGANRGVAARARERVVFAWSAREGQARVSAGRFARTGESGESQ